MMTQISTKIIHFHPVQHEPSSFTAIGTVPKKRNPFAAALSAAGQQFSELFQFSLGGSNSIQRAPPEWLLSGSVLMLQLSHLCCTQCSRCCCYNEIALEKGPNQRKNGALAQMLDAARVANLLPG